MSKILEVIKLVVLKCVMVNEFFQDFNRMKIV